MSDKLLISKKYKPLRDLSKARFKVNHEKFKTLSPKRQKYWKDLNGVNTVIMTGGRGSGKSKVEEIDALTRANDKGHKIYYTRFTNESLEDSVISDFKDAMELSGIYGKTQRSRITFESGGEIVFRGLKRGSKAQTAGGKGISKYNCQVVEEAEEHPSLKEFEKMQLSMRNKDFKNYSILMLNPASKVHWIYVEFFESRGVKEGFNGVVDDVLYIHTTYKDVKKEFHTPENWALFKRLEKFYNIYEGLSKEGKSTCDPRIKRGWSRYKFEILGGWLDVAEGVIFKDWINGVFPDDSPFMYGLDFGYSPDPTALVRCAVNKKEKLIYLEELLYSDELGTESMHEILCSIIGNGKDTIVADRQEKRLINDLKRKREYKGKQLFGLNTQPCTKGPDSVRAGIKSMLDYTIVVCGDSPNLRKELNNYAYNDKKAGVPNDEFNHLIDGSRYVFERLIKGFYVG